MRAVTREQRAHRIMTQAAITDVVVFLVKNLGRSLTAHIAEVDPKTVDRWVKGDRPRTEAEQRMRLAYQIFHVLQEDDGGPFTARPWFIGLNPQLDDISPVDVLREGRLRDVLVAAKSFASGG